MDSLLPRGLRNCNPGNIRRSKDNWKGLRPEQTDEQFFQFKEMKYGYRALIRTLQNYQRKHGLRTVTEMIHRWAPTTENNTSGYITRVCREMQVPSTYIIDVDDRTTMINLAAAISLVENGRPAVINDIQQAWDLL